MLPVRLDGVKVALEPSPLLMLTLKPRSPVTKLSSVVVKLKVSASVVAPSVRASKLREPEGSPAAKSMSSSTGPELRPSIAQLTALVWAR